MEAPNRDFVGLVKKVRVQLPFKPYSPSQTAEAVPSGSHLGPCHPDIECLTFDIERNVRYRRLQYQMPIRYRRFAPSISYVDIEGIRYRRSHYSILMVTNLRYQRSWIGLSISKFHIFDIEHKSFDIACRYRIRY